MYTAENTSGIYIDKQIRVPNFSMGYKHFHNYCEIFYLRSGNCNYFINNSKYHLEPGDIILVKPGDYHYTDYEGTVTSERYIITCSEENIPADFLKEHENLREIFEISCKVILKDIKKAQVEDLLFRMTEESNKHDEYCSDSLRLLLMQLLIMIKRGGVFIQEEYTYRENMLADIEDALRYIDQNYTHQITLEEVAQTVNLSPAWLSRKFKNATGQTFKEYLNNKRIRRATQALVTTDDSITKIAMDCGFNSSNYFKDIFRKANGLSPRAYRNECRKK